MDEMDVKALKFLFNIKRKTLSMKGLQFFYVFFFTLEKNKNFIE